MTSYDGFPRQDVLALRRSDELLDALAGRADVPGDPVDPVVGLLRALTADVDSGLVDLLATAAAGDEAPAVVPLASTRRRTVRGAATAAVLVGMLSVSGVAAAVTGDPFSPYRQMFHALQGDDDLPPKAPLATWLQHRLAGVGPAIARGDLAAARAMLDDVRSRVGGLPEAQRRALLQRLAALEARLARREAKAERKAAAQAERGDKTGRGGKHAPGGGSTGAGDRPEEKGDGAGAGAPAKDAKKPKPGKSNDPSGDDRSARGRSDGGGNGSDQSSDDGNGKDGKSDDGSREGAGDGDHGDDGDDGDTGDSAGDSGGGNEQSNGGKGGGHGAAAAR